MKKILCPIWCLALALFAWPAASYTSEERALPAGDLVGGFVEDDGSSYFVFRRDSADSRPPDTSVLVRLSRRGNVTDRVELRGVRAKAVGKLPDSRFWLWSLQGPLDRDGFGVLATEILELRPDGELRQHWEWRSSGESDAPVFSRDGKLWGVHAMKRTGVTFRFGSTRKSNGPERTEHVEFGTRDTGQWPMQPQFTFLDSEGPVVLVPWSNGAFIVHFRDGASPYSVPVLQGSSEIGFRWQPEDRILWAWSGRRLRAYHLWDLGLSGLPDEPMWEVDRYSGWRTDRERGLRRVAERDGRYRVEHWRRDPWTRVEDRHVSDWYVGSPGWVYLSPNARHAVFLDRNEPSEAQGRRARNVDLSYEPLLVPPLESAPPAETETGVDGEASPAVAGEVN